MRPILVVGSANTDLVVRVPRLPRPGETVLGGQFYRAAGGKGANQAVAAARAGGAVTFVGCIGEDAFGEQVLRGLREDGVRTDHVVRVPDDPSGVALILVDEAGENSIAVASGANARLAPEHLDALAPRFAEAGVLLLQLEIPFETVRAAAQRATAHGARVILNPAPARPLDDDLLQHVTILTPNESEAERLTGIAPAGEGGLAQAAEALLARGPEAVLITCGARGVFVAGAGHRTMVPALRVEVVDTTAAGDVFNGALAAALARGETLLEAVRYAGAAAALGVTRIGARPSIPRHAEVEALLARGPAAADGEGP